MRERAWLATACLLVATAPGCGRRAVGPTPDGGRVEHCAMCGMACQERCRATVAPPQGSVLTFCCPHCAATQMRVSATDLPADSSVTVTDWETCRPLAAKTALVVLESDLVPCCSPAAICFADRTAAQAFRKRHGGRLASWDECRAGWAVGKDGPDR